ncbi:flagellar calcium-binding protein-like [Xenia sp. Carnegie-2017]|uniref:flagellar calcium-binding protein-like n=1 Tax=Xenia sp. Carnegie-2017 TaxID=2897299 RepID=UPI001F03D1C5|nr:flagellar calcium-binding protein-like [Xenia sp. Carnegie-2017]
MDIDWTAINAKLPTARADKAARKKMFNQFDPNGNGILSLAEVEKGIRDVLHIDEIFNAKLAIMMAFKLAKNSKKSRRGDLGDDYIELREFRGFLLALRQYFEYWVAFCRTDANSDKRISLIEFVNGKSKIETWVGPINDMEAEFKKIDTNGGGFIMFDEFCKWAIGKNLDLEDDDDNIAE